jgi:hypothetical protein
MIEQSGPVLDPDSYGLGSRKPGSWESDPEDFDFDESAVPQNPNQYLSFETILETMCERLQDTKEQGSLKRLRKLEAVLEAIEQELDDLSSGRTGPA